MSSDCRRPHPMSWPFARVQGRDGRPASGVGFSDEELRLAIPSSIFVSVPPSSMENSTTTKSAAKPVQTFRLKGISASVFENKSEDGKTSFHKVSLQRSYRKDGEWKQSDSLGRDDLPIAALLLQRAWEFVLQAEAKGNTEEPKK